MRHLILFSFLSFTLTLTAQSDRYTQAMTGIVATLDTARQASAFTASAQKLERIAAAEADQWLPRYYLAFTQVQLAMNALENGQGDACETYAQAAEAQLQLVKEMTETNSEILTLEGYVNLTRIWSDPMNNGPRLSPPTIGLFQRAMAMDEANPRPTMLLGMLTLYMPEFYGGGAANALPLLEKAAGQYEAAPAERGLLPGWGQGTNHWLLEKARTDLAEHE
ncbi:MAG: hypothetical protein KDC54_10710 [Lewinella sp.]|nr:hypothetical protein [Lewinella sp.]